MVDDLISTYLELRAEYGRIRERLKEIEQQLVFLGDDDPRIEIVRSVTEQWRPVEALIDELGVEAVICSLPKRVPLRKTALKNLGINPEPCIDSRSVRFTVRVKGEVG